MSGFITEAHLDEAEGLWPGISGFYDLLMSRGKCPSTFLNLVAAYTAYQSNCSSCLARAVRS